MSPSANIHGWDGNVASRQHSAGGQAMLAVVTRSRIVRELARWGMETGEAAEVIDLILQRTADALINAAEETLGVPRSVVEACEAQVERLLRQH
jgi:hypothetical protein